MTRAVAILIGILLLTGCGKQQKESEAPDNHGAVAVETEPVTRMTVHERIALDGSYVLSPGDDVKLTALVTGKLTAVLFTEGDYVKSGQLVARIDESVLADQQKSAALAADAAGAQAKQSERALAASVADNNAAIKAAQLALESAQTESRADIELAQLELHKMKAGPRPQELAVSEQAVKQAQISKEKSLADAERDKKLLGEGFVSGQQADASAAAYQLSVSQLEQAIAQRDLLRNGARSEDLKTAELKLATAQDVGAKRIAAATASLALARQGKVAVEAKAQEAVASRLSAAQKRMDAAVAAGITRSSEIRAPFDGYITRRFVGVGATVDPTSVVLEMARKSANVLFIGTVSPQIASNILPGMKASADDSKVGVVRSIGMVDGTTGQTPVRVEFATNPHVSPGEYARLELIKKTYVGALVVPDVAITTTGDKSSVFVVRGGVAKNQTVELGPSEAGSTMIRNGLSAGDTVVTTGQHELSDGVAVEIEHGSDKKADAIPSGARD